MAGADTDTATFAWCWRLPLCSHCDTAIRGIDALEIELQRTDELRLGMFGCPACDVILCLGGAGRNNPDEP
jgi:hypothetical protein